MSDMTLLQMLPLLLTVGKLAVDSALLVHRSRYWCCTRVTDVSDPKIQTCNLLVCRMSPSDLDCSSRRCAGLFADLWGESECFCSRWGCICFKLLHADQMHIATYDLVWRVESLIFWRHKPQLPRSLEPDPEFSRNSTEAIL